MKDNLSYEEIEKQIDKLVNEMANCRDPKMMKTLEGKLRYYLEEFKKNKPQPPLLCKTCHWWRSTIGCIFEIIPEVKNNVESCRKYKDESQYRKAGNIIAKIFQNNGFEVIEDEDTQERMVKMGKRKNGHDFYCFLKDFELAEDLETIRLRKHKNI